MLEVELMGVSASGDKCRSYSSMAVSFVDVAVTALGLDKVERVLTGLIPPVVGGICLLSTQGAPLELVNPAGQTWTRCVN